MRCNLCIFKLTCLLNTSCFLCVCVKVNNEDVKIASKLSHACSLIEQTCQTIYSCLDTVLFLINYSHSGCLTCTLSSRNRYTDCLPLLSRRRLETDFIKKTSYRENIVQDYAERFVNLAHVS